MRKRARTLLLMLAFACAGIPLALLLGGCAEPPQRIEGSGEIVIVPALIDYCARNPTHRECGGTE